MAVDYLILSYSMWIFITYTYHYGITRIGLSGITVVEQLGAYLAARVTIKNVTDYKIFIRALFVVILILFPFALFELLTGKNLWSDLLDPVFTVHQKPSTAYGRMGLERVMSVFEHPILFGLFCSLGIANFFYVYQKNVLSAVAMMLFATGMTFMSLSSAPLMAVASQALLITWDKVTKGRWVLLTLLMVIAYITIDVLSNRTPVTILIGTLTFNPLTAWIRMSIWDYGYAAVIAHPIMGIGLEDWPRPNWLTSSVDNFWLLIGMRHGIPAVALLVGALSFHLFAILRAKNLPSVLVRYRTGYVLALLCLYFTLCTVHVWGGMSSFVFFYIGAGLWFVSAAGQGSEAIQEFVDSPQYSARSTMGTAATTRTSGLARVRPEYSAELPQSRFPNAHRRESCND